ncbi:MAG TPA: DUF1684 domain-containing protein [Actinomycetota bacterium]|nr:DUF1684 domain-containing protein [Actinomycetota bacterium]
MIEPAEALDLLDWKRRVAELYAFVRHAHPRAGWQRWREARDELFRAHPQSPLPVEQRGDFGGLEVYPYDESFRVAAEIEPAPNEELRVPSSRDEEMVFTRFGTASFRLGGSEHSLEVFWIAGYGGGLFLPFRDATSGETTYGAGRYLYDTIKGADLGTTETGALVLDFNFAYNPSCAYDPRWSCPLAPPGNVLDVRVEAGEKTPA